MTLPSLAAALELVARANESEFIGVRESLHFEAKGATGWDLDSPAARYELAKDVSSFANSEGGAIVIGFRTQSAAGADLDEIASAELIAASEFDANRIKGILDEYIFPEIKGLQVFWQPSVNNSSLGFGVITVPQQPEDRRPFLVARVTEDTVVVKQIVTGFARRTGASSTPHGPSELQKAFKSGMDSMAQRLSRIEEKVDLLLSTEGSEQIETPASSAVPQEERLDERIKSILEAR